MIAMVLLGACKKAATPDCDGAGKAIEAAAADTAANGKDELARETARRVGPAAGANVVLRCKQDGWSAAATDCVKNAKGGAKFSDCESKLTKEQAEKLKTGVPALAGTVDPGAPTTNPPAGAPADCAGVEASMTKFWNERVGLAKTETERKSAEEMRVTARTRIGKHCNEDKWSAAAADCFKAVTNGDFASCESNLTPAQISSLKASAPAIDPMKGMTPPPATGSADGSAAGSAADGSAATP